METWDIASLDVQPHQPEVLRTDPEARVIAINLPAGEELQEHQVHERAYVVVAAGEVEIEQDGGDGVGRPRLPRALRAQRAARGARHAATRACCCSWRPGPARAIRTALTPALASGSRWTPPASASCGWSSRSRPPSCLATALIYTSFSASTEASKPSEIEPGPAPTS